MNWKPLYQVMAWKLNSIANCKKDSNFEWIEKHEDSLARLIELYMPEGSGIDRGVILEPDSTEDKLIFSFEFHHMNENGWYTKWTKHKAIVTGSLKNGYDLKITGKAPNMDYLYDWFHQSLSTGIGSKEESK